jgi:hypothetical protein
VVLGAFSLAVVTLATATVLAFNANTGPKKYRQFTDELIRNLPSGALYMNVGTNALSTNVWLLQRQTDPIQLTKNRPGYGISTFSASRNGIVVADASSGVDELKIFSRGQFVPINVGNGGHGESPAINSHNELTFGTVPFGKDLRFRIGLESLRSGKITWIASTTSKWGTSDAVWGPDQSLAYVSPLSPLGNSELPLIYVVSKSGAKTIYKVDGNVNNLIWGEHAPLLVLEYQDGSTACLNLATKSLTPVPAPWFARAWSPDGSQLLVDSGHTLGLWNPAHPTSVQRIGSFANGYGAGQIEWLSSPVK